MKLLQLLFAISFASPVLAAAFNNSYGKLPASATPGDRLMQSYLQSETESMAARGPAQFRSLADWEKQQPGLRSELFEMLGLSPLPQKTALKPVVTGRIEKDDFAVEKLHFQSMPGLYVTANLYLPKSASGPFPTILYVCGHSPAKTNGVSYGNKVGYQHHGIWFARHGYACLVMDTIQLGEIEGIHHGTYREGMWWWNSRGYTSAGAEAWNCIRALDYLETRPEVDRTRFGVTGRSGGGAYSWWISALDDRIKASCPVAGITDLQNHVIDGTVEGHCDCMFMVNTYRWDYSTVASLVAPRPLLICNTDKDTIFPLDGVSRIHEQVRHVYGLHGATDRLGLLITEGPHKDTQDLQIPVLRWFNRFLKNEEKPIRIAAEPMFSGQELKVFDRLPGQEITSTCHESFTKTASDSQPLNVARTTRDLALKTFGLWPKIDQAPAIKLISEKELDGIALGVYEFESQPGVPLRFYYARPTATQPRMVHLFVADEPEWKSRLQGASALFATILKEELELAGLTPGIAPMEAAETFAAGLKYLKRNEAAWITFTPRGIGRTAPGGDKKYQTQIRRRFMLVGGTLAGMQTFDVCRCLDAVKTIPTLTQLGVQLHAAPEMTEVCAFATVFRKGVDSLTIPFAPRADKEAPDFLNWSRILSHTQLLQLAKTACEVRIEKE